jgi:Ca-activated chloride channel family protein
MTTLLRICLLALFAALAACQPGGGGPAGTSGGLTLPDIMREGYETYHETGGVARPANAVDVFIVYSPESQTYMPRVIAEFNRQSAAGTNPVTGQPWGADRPVFIAGQDPTRGSSGTVAQGIVNAFIAPNNENVYHPTIFQPSVSHWLALVNFNAGREVFNLAESQPTAQTPLVIAMWESRARAIQQKTGREAISWQDLIDVLESENGWCDYGLPDCRRAVYYGHTDPTISSTGLSVTMAEFYACARRNGFTERQITEAAATNPQVQACVREIEGLVRHYSSRAEDFLEYVARGPEYLDFLSLEETDLICINRGAQQGDETCTRPAEKLVAIYPEEGTFWHEHPFGIVNAEWVTPEQQAAARVFTQWVLTAAMQQIILSEGFRPVNPAVAMGFPITAENGADPSQPRAILDVPPPDVIVSIQQSWQLVKKQADILLLIDVSGSMLEEGKLEQAKEAALAFLDGMEANNRIGLATFSTTVSTLVPMGNAETVRAEIRSRIQNLRADGGTALFAAVQRMVEQLNQQDDPDRIRAVIVLSDGEDTSSNELGVSLNDAIAAINASQDSVNPVLVIPVAYGGAADINALNSLARASSTQIQAGDPGNIRQVLDLIGSYF